MLHLHRNMRVELSGQNSEHIAELHKYADWLLRLGNGQLPVNSSGNITLPADLCVKTVEDLVQLMFGRLTVNYHDANWVSSRAILCP